MKTEKINVQKICLIAFAICINFVGGQIALFLKLPIYLDSIGTVFIASILGPFYGMLPNLISGLLMGMTVDIYSLYYAPVGIVLGFVTGLVYREIPAKKMADFSGSCCNHPSINPDQLLHHRVFIWRNHLFWFLHSCTASFQNTSWNGRKLFCGPVCHRLH